MRKWRTNLTRSLSASRSSAIAKAVRKRTVSEIVRSDLVEGVSGGVETKVGGEEDLSPVVAVNTSSSAAAAAAVAAAAAGGAAGGAGGGGGSVDNVRTAAPAFRKTSEDLQTEALATLLVLDKAKGLECLKVMRGYMATCWWFVQPLLFCLIGADIPVEKLRADTIDFPSLSFSLLYFITSSSLPLPPSPPPPPQPSSPSSSSSASQRVCSAPLTLCAPLPPGRGIASILIALAFRMGASILAVTPSPLKWKERVFVAVAWIPKATVQAAIGPLALDSARATGDATLISWGEQIITLSALSILLTAPLAALLIPLVAPYLLHQDLIFIPVEGTDANHNDNAYSDNDEEGEDSHKHHHHHRIARRKERIAGSNDEKGEKAGDWSEADDIFRGISKEGDKEGTPSTLETAL
uniref:Mitochondrial sodium:hydrogen exchanger n=1 Tax=Echinococcus granulosus TaxID=6210 RepID=A0A068WLQ9_ECHGR|nr:mitochondrial sodium:hydrogen exchanger [Echinococcus granulosus]